MGLIMTLGTIEVINVPHELYLMGRRTLLGQTIRVNYDASNAVRQIYLDGEPLILFLPSPHSEWVQEVPPRRAEQGAETPPVNSEGAAQALR